MGTATCDYCGKKFSDSMRLCPFCNAEYTKDAVHETPVCPLCTVELEAFDFKGDIIDKCPKCQGIWLGSSDFRKLTSERSVFQDETIPWEHKRKPVEPKKKYLKCPVCESVMSRRIFKRISGVLIDVCRQHGVWLDEGELEQIRSFVASGGVEEMLDKRMGMSEEMLKQLETKVREQHGYERMADFFKLKRWMFRKL